MTGGLTKNFFDIFSRLIGLIYGKFSWESTLSSVELRNVLQI